MLVQYFKSLKNLLDPFSLLSWLITLSQGVSVVSKCFVMNRESQDCDPRFPLFGNNRVIIRAQIKRNCFGPVPDKSFTFIVIAFLI